MLPEYGPAQVKQDIMKALLLCAFGGQFQDLCVAVKQLAGIAGCCCCFHLISSQHPHLHACLMERLDGVCCFFLEPVMTYRYISVQTFTVITWETFTFTKVIFPCMSLESLQYAKRIYFYLYSYSDCCNNPWTTEKKTLSLFLFKTGRFSITLLEK